MNQTDRVSRGRQATYLTLFGVLTVAFLILRLSPWQGSVELHTLMEAVGMMLSFFVGTMAIVRFYSRKSNLFLFIGAGFLGTGLLDGYHAVVNLMSSALVNPIPLIESGVSIPKHEIGNPLSVPVLESTGEAKFNQPFHI